MNRAEAIQELLQEYAAQREQNERELRQRETEAAQKDPEIGRLREESVQLVMDTMRLILSQSDPEAKEAATREMEQRGKARSLEIARRLKALGLPGDHLEMRYRCPVCRDTAYVGEAPARFCSCFEGRLRTKMHEDGSMANTAEQNFDTFDLSLIPQENGQRDQMEAWRSKCLRYANRFPETETLNLLIFGAGGLGKTFLLNCIYERVVSRGFSAVRVDAFRLFEAMRRQHYAGNDGSNDFASLMDAPLLLIDDLGTEPMLRNITVEYLFLLLNARLTARRHTVIVTNLDLEQLRVRYGERVYSRLSDRRATLIMRLTGKDLRQL